MALKRSNPAAMGARTGLGMSVCLAAIDDPRNSPAVAQRQYPARGERLISGRPDVLALWTEATKRNPGGANNPHGRAGKPQVEINFDNVQDDLTAPTGNSAAAGLRRLQKEAASDDEDKAIAAKAQLDEVLAGRKSVHAAFGGPRA